MIFVDKSPNLQFHVYLLCLNAHLASCLNKFLIVKLREGRLTALMVTLGHWSGRPLSCVTAQHWNMFPHLAPSLPSVQRKSVDGAASGAWNSPYFSYLEIFYLYPPTYPPSLARTSLLFIFIHFRCILVHFISSYHEAAFNEMFLEDS